MSTKAFAEALVQKLGLTLTFVHKSKRTDSRETRESAEVQGCWSISLGEGLQWDTHYMLAQYLV